MSYLISRKEEYLDALSKVNEDTEAFHMIKSLINKYFAMVEHMKKTSLYDVFTYEDRVTEAFVEPMKILACENENLKKEVNNLRQQLGLKNKYKIRKGGVI